MHPWVLHYLSQPHKFLSCTYHVDTILIAASRKNFWLFNTYHSQCIDLLANLTVHSQKWQEPKWKQETYLKAKIRDFTHTHTSHTSQNKHFQFNQPKHSADTICIIPCRFDPEPNRNVNLNLFYYILTKFNRRQPNTP